MKKIFISFSSLMLLIPTTFVLSSCATTSQSLPAIKFSFANTTLNGEKLSENNYAVGFNATNSQQFVIYKKSIVNNEEKYDAILSSQYTQLQNILGKIVIPTIDFSNKLINVAHVTENDSNDSLWNSNMIFNSDESNIDLFKEFLLASANLLNQGKKNQIKFSLSNIEFSPLTSGGSTITNFELNDIYDVEPIHSKSHPYKFIKLNNENPTEEEKNKWDKKTIYYKNENGELQQGKAVEYAKFLKNYSSNILYKENDISHEYNIKLTYKYFDPQDSNAFRKEIPLDQIKSYVKQYNAWNNIVEPTKNQFTLNYNLKFKLRTQYNAPNIGYLILDDDKKITDAQKNALAISTIQKDTTTLENNLLTNNNTQNPSEYSVFLNKESSVTLNNGILYTPNNIDQNKVGDFLKILNNFSNNNSSLPEGIKFDSNDNWSNYDTFASKTNGANELINYIPKENIKEYHTIIKKFKGMLSINK